MLLTRRNYRGGIKKESSVTAKSENIVNFEISGETYV